MGERDTAQHEAGHAVADYRLGFGVLQTSILPADGNLGHELPMGGWDDTDSAERYVISLLAGFAAELEFDPSRMKQARLGACQDFEDATSVVERLAPPDPRRHMKDLLHRAFDLVRQNRAAIDALAAELIAHRTLPGDEVEFIVEIADGDGCAADLDAYRNLKYAADP